MLVALKGFEKTYQNKLLKISKICSYIWNLREVNKKSGN